MKVQIEVNVPDTKNEKTLKQNWKKSSKIVSKIKNIPGIKDVKVINILDDSGVPIQEIDIDLFGSLKILGGFSFIDSTQKKYNLIVVDEGASYLLFEVDNNKALFHGALTGMEEDRFFKSKPGQKFSYYRRIYTKLTTKEINTLVCPIATYKYDTADKVESPRNKNSK